MKKAFSIFIIFLVCAVTSASYAAIYYVRTDGNDTASGLNDTNDPTTGAFLTVNKANSVLTTGYEHTVIIEDGVFLETAVNAITVTVSGQDSTHPVEFKAKNRRLADVRKGFIVSGDYIKIYQLKITPKEGWGCSDITSTGDYVNIEDCSCYPSGNNCGGFEVGGDYDTIKDNYIENPQYGITVENTSTYATIDGNEINGLYQYDSAGDLDWMRVWGIGHVVKNNLFHGALTITGTPHVDCWQNWGWDGAVFSDIVIENNYCEGFAEATMFNFYNATDLWSGLVIRNNVIKGGTNGFIIYGVQNVKIYNNTFIDLQYSGRGSEGSANPASSCTGCEIKNNIYYNVYYTDYQSVYTMSAACGDKSDADVVSNNLIFTPGGAHTWLQADYPNDIVNEDPLFVNSSSNYRLTYSSPAKDKGLTLTGFAYDKDAVSRRQGSAWDIGAYELEQAPAPPSNLKIISP